MQNFKGDEIELKFLAVAEGVGEPLSLSKDEFYDDAYNCTILGEVLFDNNLSPLANAIPRDIFRESFQTIFEQFLVAGSAESYLVVFRKIFGEDVDVEFTIPAVGKLDINISSIGFELTNFAARIVDSSEYVYYDMITQDGDEIVFQSLKGFTSEYELEQMLFEMVPDGIFTTITLDLGG